jgi:excisionase family DNA binding protein
VGTDHNFRVDEFADTMRSRLVSVFSDALATAKIPALDVASRYSELGDALLPAINPAVSVRYGIEIPAFIVENVSAPPEVESAIHTRSRMPAIGTLTDFVKTHRGPGRGPGAGGAGAAGTAAELAIGFGIAQQLMGAGSLAAPAGGAAPAADLMGPAEAAKYLGVTEADVMASIAGGQLKAKRIGSQYRIAKSAIDAFLAE